jgi:hypothetical protein
MATLSDFWCTSLQSWVGTNEVKANRGQFHVLTRAAIAARIAHCDALLVKMQS